MHALAADLAIPREMGRALQSIRENRTVLYGGVALAECWNEICLPNHPNALLDLSEYQVRYTIDKVSMGRYQATVTAAMQGSWMQLEKNSMQQDGKITAV